MFHHYAFLRYFLSPLADQIFISQMVSHATMSCQLSPSTE